VRQRIVEAADLERLASNVSVLLSSLAGSGTALGALAPMRGLHTCSLVASVAWIFFSVGSVASTVASGKYCFRISMPK
jgi:hypothetical protein